MRKIIGVCIYKCLKLGNIGVPILVDKYWFDKIITDFVIVIIIIIPWTSEFLISNMNGIRLKFCFLDILCLCFYVSGIFRYKLDDYRFFFFFTLENYPKRLLHSVSGCSHSH